MREHPVGVATPGSAYRIHGMDCAEEVAALKRELGPLVGREDRLAFDVFQAKMTILGSPLPAPNDVTKAVVRAGLRAEPWEDPVAATGVAAAPRPDRRAIFAAASGVLTVAGAMAQWLGTVDGTAAMPLYAAGTLAGAWFVLPRAWSALRRARPDMNLLMTVAIAGAMFLGEWFEASTVACLFGLSLTLESWSVGRARRAVKNLLNLAPPVATVLGPDARESEVPLAEIAVGSSVLVRPGERIPLDGVVTRGASDVNQAPITGESLPAFCGVGDPVFAGSINGAGAMEIRTTRPASDTTLARIIRLVTEAHHRRARAEQWVDRFARVYTPVVMSAALLIGVIPPLLLGAAWSPWIYRALVLLVIACPCALVISTPVSIVAAIAAAARHGVLVKGGLYVEIPATLRAIAIDKTGTLTLGRPEVVEFALHEESDERTFLARAAALEARSEHPLARAVVHFAASRGVVASPVESFRAVPGKGGTGVLDGEAFWIGSPRMIAEQGLLTDAVRARVESLSSSGRSVLALGTATRVCGFLAVADAVRHGARESIRALRDEGLERVVMLTGDNEASASSVAAAIDVDDYRAGLLPEDKVAAIEELVRDHGSVAMIGDGVNDAPALARASLGIAMGGAGSDATLETSDVTLMSDDLSKVVWLVRHSRRTLRIIRQNVAFSLGVKAIFVALTFAGFATLWGAIAADTGASLLVIANGLRLLRSGEGS